LYCRELNSTHRTHIPVIVTAITRQCCKTNNPYVYDPEHVTHMQFIVRLALRYSGLLRREEITTSHSTSVRNYHYSLRNNPEERSSHLLRGGSLKSRTLYPVAEGTHFKFNCRIRCSKQKTNRKQHVFRSTVCFTILSLFVSGLKSFDLTEAILQ